MATNVKTKPVFGPIKQPAEEVVITPLTGPNGVLPFAHGMNFYKLFWIFFIGSVAGVVVETLYALITRHQFESRVGMIYGPFNAVYGFGALVMTLCLYKLDKRRDLWIFLGSMFIGGAFEYLCSLFQELAFGTVSWEYSDTQFNFHGRTNIMFAFFWGILGLLWVKDLFPWLSKTIEKIPKKFGVAATWVLLVFMVFNMAMSAAAVYRQSLRREGVTPRNSFEVFLDAHYTDEFLSKKFPTMTVTKQV